MNKEKLLWSIRIKIHIYSFVSSIARDFKTLIIVKTSLL